MSCAPAAERVYLAPSNETVTSGMEAAYDGRGQHIWVHNLSSEEVIITSVTLYECKNVKNRCEVDRMNFKVGPGERRRLMTVELDNPERAHSFRYRWTWQPASAAPVLSNER